MNGGTHLHQDIWWTDREGITRLIDDLTDDHRRFIARMLIDTAAMIHLRSRIQQIEDDWWSYFEAGEAAFDRGSWGPVSMDEAPTMDESIRLIRREQDHGAHLKLIRESRLFQRMVRDLEWLHPGVLVDDAAAA